MVSFVPLTTIVRACAAVEGAVATSVPETQEVLYVPFGIPPPATPGAQFDSLDGDCAYVSVIVSDFGPSISAVVLPSSKSPISESAPFAGKRSSIVVLAQFCERVMPST